MSNPTSQPGHDIPAMSVYIGKLLPNVIELGVDEGSASHAITSIESPMGETMLMYEVQYSGGGRGRVLPGRVELQTPE